MAMLILPGVITMASNALVTTRIDGAVKEEAAAVLAAMIIVSAIEAPAG